MSIKLLELGLAVLWGHWLRLWNPKIGNGYFPPPQGWSSAGNLDSLEIVNRRRTRTYEPMGNGHSENPVVAGNQPGTQRADGYSSDAEFHDACQEIMESEPHSLAVVSRTASAVDAILAYTVI
jgi:hypothetical protein